MIEQAEYRHRRAQVVAGFAERKVDALLVTALPNVRYLTGFTGSNGALLLTPERAIFFTDPRYTIQAGQETSCIVRIVRGAMHLGIVKNLKGLKRIGFESGRLTFGFFHALQEKLPLGASLEPAGNWLEELRMVKSVAEIALIRRSVDLNSEAFARVMKRVRPPMTESELAAEIDYQMRKLGAERPAFETIVASGARTALPHAQPSETKLGANGLLLIDMGASRAGYASDMTRMAHLGKPSGKISAMYRAVLDAQMAALSVVRAGASTKRVDQAARQVLASAGLEKAFVHSTGHGLGLEIHEPPRLGKRDKTRLAAGMVVTIEPGAYVEGFGGIRIEDTVLVTRGGCEVLTPTRKELLVL